MIRRTITALLLAILALVLVSFAIANRQMVTVSLDPFNEADPALVFTQPLYVIVFALVTGGVVLGGCAAWLRQGKWRSRARRAEAERDLLRAQLSERSGAPEAGPAGRDPVRLMVPPPAA